ELLKNFWACSASSAFKRRLRTWCPALAGPFVANRQREHAAAGEDGADENEAHREAVRSVADVSDQRGADEPTDVPDRIDERDARGGAYSADSRRRESPEWTEHRGEPEHRQRQRGERRREPVKRAAHRKRR